MNTRRCHPSHHALAAALAIVALVALPAVATEQAATAEQAETAEQKLPSAREVIDRYVEAIGGAEALRQPKSLQMTGEFTVPAAGLEGKLEIRSMPPDLMLVEVEIPGLGLTREGFDGEVAWSIDPMQGPRLKQGAELEQAAYQADFYAALHEEERYESMETVGRVEFDGRECYKLELVTANGDEMVEYYDIETGLHVGTEMQVETPMGPAKVVQTMGDYEAFGDLRFPTETTVSVGPMKQMLTITDVERDSVDRTAFELPDEIRALVTD